MRTRTAPAPDVQAPEPEDNERLEEGEGDDEQADLQFQETLSWHVGKPIPTGELLKRLQALAHELKETDQEVIRKSSLSAPAQELAHSNLLRHRDKGVKAWTAHCLVDVLRLAAPDAPFSAAQLKEIFTLFVSHSIPLLASSTDPYYDQHLHVLHILQLSKAIILVTDISGSSALIQSLFSSCFDILSQSGDSISKNLEYDLSGLLQCIVEESDNLPLEVVEIILAQFLRADSRSSSVTSAKGKKSGNKPDLDANQTRLQLRQLTPAYTVAQNVCNTCMDRMSRNVVQYFSSIMLNISSSVGTADKFRLKHKRQSDDDMLDEDQQHGPSKDDLEQLEKAHELLRELWKTCPGMLQSVIPLLETELSAENVEARKLATQAIGDMISGIGVEASLAPPSLDPAAHPPMTLDLPPSQGDSPVDSRAPKATQSFSQTHVSTYQSFLSRRNDKSSDVRAAWTTGIGRALCTSAGGIGLNPQDQSDFVGHLSQMLVDSDEKVRIAAIQALTLLDFRMFVTKIGAVTPPADSQSIMDRLTDRAKDMNAAVRSEASNFLGRLWGVGAHEIATDNNQVLALLREIPSKILNGAYANKTEINSLIDRVLFESFLPLGYPVQKKKEKRSAAKNGTQIPESGPKQLSEKAADRIRVERLLVLCQCLDTRAKAALLSIMRRPAQLARPMKLLLDMCDEYNGGVMDKDSKETKSNLSKLIDYFAQLASDPAKFVDDFWLFVKKNDRRCYILIRFCIAEDSDYLKIHKSIKELMRRLDALSLKNSTVPETMTSLLYRVSNLFYNKSHLGRIIELLCQQRHALAGPAQELLKDLSERAPGVFKAHGQELCHFVEEHAPNYVRSNDAGALDPLKACATFARRYREDVPKDRKFSQAMMRYAWRGSPPSAAKYAVSILLSSKDKKEMHAKDIMAQSVADFKYGSEFFLSQLAALSQLMLLNAKNMDEETEVDPILQIAITEVLAKPPPSSTDVESAAWSQDIEARRWALKIIANRLRCYPSAKAIKDISGPVYQLLNQLVEDAGEMVRGKNQPEKLRFSLQLQASLLLLKLCSHSDFDTLLTPSAFNALMRLAQATEYDVRSTFVTKVKKYLGQDRLPSRFYNVVFLLAFEPSKKLQRESSIWLRARAAAFAKAQKFYLEAGFARLLSVLVHHPDYSEEEDDLRDLITYMVFYLQNIATAENISLIYHVAQRVKTVRDGIDDKMSPSLYYTSDVAVAAINAYTAIQNWSLQAHSGKVGMPIGIFASIQDHSEAQRIAETQYLSEEAADQVGALVRSALKVNKRKPDGSLENPSKRRNTAGATVTARPKAAAQHKSNHSKAGVKTPRKTRAAKDDASDDDDVTTRSSAVPESASRRKSSRAAGRKVYTEISDDDADADMATYEHGVSPNGNKENSRGGVVRAVR